MEAPTGYTPYAEFTENGITFKAFIPGNSDVEQKFIVYAVRNEEVIRELDILMTHAPIFGVDVEDIQELEAQTEILIQELKKENEQ